MDTIKNIFHMDHVTTQFDGVVAVNGLPLDINEHKIIALIDPNGARKTTALNCVIGIYQPTYGSVSFNSQVILTDTPRGKMCRLYASDVEPAALTPVRKTLDQIAGLEVVRTFQNVRLFGNLTVFENVLTAKHMRAEQNVFSAALRLDHTEEKRMRDEPLNLLEVQGLIHLRDEVASSLLYGLRRRLEIARALVTSPNLLLLDEPAAGMNPQEAQDFIDFIKQIRDDYHLTILMIEYHIDLVIQISDCICMLDFGKLIVQSTPDEVQSNSKVIEAYLGVSDDVND